MRNPLKVAVLSFMLLSSGGAIVASRELPSFRSKIPGIYPSAWLAFYMASSGGGVFQSGDCNNNASAWARLIGWTVVTPLSVLAIPGAVIADTILLPLDIYRGNVHREMPLSAQEVEKAKAGP